jgi:hypothetical protein
MSNICPQKGCNSPALLLLSLRCANPKCINYNSQWHAEITSTPKYEHKTIGEHIFLGGFSVNGRYYDLYHSINPLDDTEWVEARYGDALDCYEGEELIFAPLHKNEVIQEAARRWNSRITKKNE